MKKLIFVLFCVVLSVVELSAQNVATKATISSSWENDLSSAENAIDGDNNSRWETRHGVGQGSLFITLDDTYSLNYISINWEGASASNYAVMVSADNENWTEVGNYSGMAGAYTQRTRVGGLEVKYISINCYDRSTPYGYSIYEITIVPKTAEDSLYEDNGMTHLPLVYIDTKGKYLSGSNKNTENCYITIVYNDGELLPVDKNIDVDHIYYEGNVRMHVRGQTSAGFPKKPYSVTLYKDDTFTDKDSKNLFGMGKENDWILYASYNDKSLIRNKLSMDWYKEMGHWCSDFQYCEVYLNGEYIGIYALMEKYKRDKNRIVVQEMNPDDHMDTGYLFSFDKVGKFDDNPLAIFSTARTNTGSKFIIEYPKSDILERSHRDYLFDYISSYESYLYKMSYDTVFLDYIDAITFADYFIINEVVKNIDGYRISVYMTKDVNRKIAFDNIWDYDLSLANSDDKDGSNYSTWLYSNAGMRTDGYAIPFWWNSLLKSKDFIDLINTRWKELENTVFEPNKVSAQIDSLSKYLRMNGCVERNFSRWDMDEINQNSFNLSWLNGVQNTYEGEIARIKKFISDRLTWLKYSMVGTKMSDEKYQSFTVAPSNVAITPSSVFAMNGEDVELTVSAEGEGLFYQWQYQDENIEGATSSTLKIDDITAYDAGKYTCVVKNYAGTVNKELTVFVDGTSSRPEEPPVKIEFPTNQMMCKVYPNPVTEVLHVESSELLESYALYDINGRLMDTQKVSSDAVEISIEDLSSGIYKLIVKDKCNNQKVWKIMKQ